MKVAQALGWYFPESLGGTEVYVETLTRSLGKLGLESMVVAPSATGLERETSHRGVPVFLYSAVGERAGSQRMGEWIGARGAAVYHQHSWTSGCGLQHLRTAKEMGLKTVTTVHVPGPICLRGTMMLNGVAACDGLIREVRCGACWARCKGAPALLAELMARLPLPVSAASVRWLPKSRLATALGWRALVARHAWELNQLGSLSDRVVTVARWLFDALARNGVPEAKLFLSRHGLELGEHSQARLPIRQPGEGLTVGFLGRWDPVKGLDLLVRAVRRVPDSVSIRLVVHATGDGETERRYRRQVMDLAQGDPRIEFAGPLTRDQILSALAGFDVLAVPSQWLEAGPYVVLEALSVGTPVLGSNLGGIRELVREGVDGWLLPHSDLGAWEQALTRLAGGQGVARVGRRVRSANEVAVEMATLYHSLSAHSRVGPR